MKVFATYNIKGGVGKTATAVNLAYLSSLDGARTLIWDLDPQGAATFYFRIKAKIKGGARRLFRGKGDLDPFIKGTDFDGLDLLPADFSYRHMDLALGDTKKPGKQLARLLRPLAVEYDILFFDCAPSISLASESVFGAADTLLVPTIPTTLSLRTLDQLRRYLHKRGMADLQVLPFFCMVDRRKGLHRDICDSREMHPFDFLTTEIPYSSLVEQMGTRRAPLATFAHLSRAAVAYRALWREVRERQGVTVPGYDQGATVIDQKVSHERPAHK